MEFIGVKEQWLFDMVNIPYEFSKNYIIYYIYIYTEFTGIDQQLSLIFAGSLSGRPSISRIPGW